MKRQGTGMRIDISSILKRKIKQAVDSVDGITITLPFISLNIIPDNKERKIAREIVIRLADKRVLNSYECCDSCIKHALASLHEIRVLLVDKQVELMDYTDSGLYLLVELILDSIR